MKTHTGECHCGKVSYTVEDDLENVIECDCSHCYAKGLILSFVPQDNFHLTINGKEASPDESVSAGLTEYLFNKKFIHHVFCDVCGVESYAYAIMPDGQKTVSVNLRCFKDFDIGTVTIMKYSGKDL